MRLNTHMMLIAGFASIVTAMPAGSSSDVLRCAGHPCAEVGSLCINNACAKPCNTNDDCRWDKGEGCADVHTPNNLQQLGKHCVSKDICDKDYQSPNYWVTAHGCQEYCGKLQEDCTSGSGVLGLTQIYYWGHKH